MNSIIDWMAHLTPSDMFYWVMAAIIFILIIGIGNMIKYYGRQFFRSDRGETIWIKIMNLIILFVVTVFGFSYLLTSTWMYESLFVLGDTSITPILILTLTFSIIIAMRFSKLLRESVLSSLYRRYDIDISIQATINTLLHYTIILFIVLFSLNSLGFNFTSLTVFASVLGVGIGFGLKNIMNNFVSGLIILFDRPIKVGDRVVVDGTIIDIEKIQIRNTIGHTRANERIVIPNSYFLEEKFINRSYFDKQLRITVAVGITYGSDLVLATELLKEAVFELQETKWETTMRDPKPRVFVEEFRDFEILMKVWFFIDDQGNEFEFIIPSDLRYLIYEKFNAHGVEFSFPRQDIYLLDEENKRY